MNDQLHQLEQTYNNGNGSGTYTFDSFANLLSGATTTGHYPVIRLAIKVNSGYTLTNINFETNKNWNNTHDGIIIGKLPSTFDFSIGPFNAKYWNDNWSGTSYGTGELPSVVDTTFHSITYANNYRAYIRTNQTGKHEACLLYTNDITACFSPKLWDTDNTTTMAIIQNELKKQLGLTLANTFTCETPNNYSAQCFNGSYGVVATLDGTVRTQHKYNNNWNRCDVDGSGNAYCVPIS